MKGFAFVKRARLSVKLMVSFLSVAALVLLVGAFGIYGELRMKQHVVELGDTKLPLIVSLDHLNIERLQIRALTLEVMGYTLVSEDNRKLLEQVNRGRAAAWPRINAALERFKAFPRSVDQEAIFQAFLADYESWVANNGKLDRLIEQLISAADQETYNGLLAQYRQLVHDNFLVSDRVAVLIESMVAVNNQAVSDGVKVGMTDADLQVGLTAAGMIFGLVLAVGLGLLMTRDTLLQLGGEPAYAVDVVNRISQGDLTIDIKLRKGDTSSLLAAFSTMVGNMRRLLSQVTSASEQVASASAQLSTTSEETREQVRLEQSETDQVATAMNEMTATVEEVARHAADAARAAEDADKEAGAGSEVVTQTIAAIEALAREVVAAADVITRLSDDSQEIGAVLDVIRGVAEQTNLLALNAAIEAARAGEQGRGFAVVAAEVRMLASRTQSSIQDIQEKIERVQHGSNGAVQAMQKGQNKASESVAQARRAGDSLRTISEAITRINDMNRQIASAAEEQTAVAEEINRNIHTISSTVDQTATGSEHIAAASVQLANLAAQLQERVGQFKV